MPMPRVHFDFGERGAKTITKVQECHKTKEKKKGKTDSCREPHVPLVAPARPQGFTPPWPGLYPGITPLLLWASGWTSRSPQAYENIGRAWETSFPSDAGSGLNPSSDRHPEPWKCVLSRLHVVSVSVCGMCTILMVHNPARFCVQVCIFTDWCVTENRQCMGDLVSLVAALDNNHENPIDYQGCVALGC